jgi:hypothetical protein
MNSLTNYLLIEMLGGDFPPNNVVRVLSLEREMVNFKLIRMIISLEPILFHSDLDFNDGIDQGADFEEHLLDIKSHFTLFSMEMKFSFEYNRDIFKV